MVKLSLVLAVSMCLFDPLLAQRSVDYESCFQDLLQADANGDGGVTRDEFLAFTQSYSSRACLDGALKGDELTIQLAVLFHNLSCYCSNADGSEGGACCLTAPKIFGWAPAAVWFTTNYLKALCFDV